MFIETHSTNSTEGEGITLHFIKSLNVQVYPCGRRRSQVIDEGKVTERFMPYDPEARLNTEYNNINRSSLNGFTQTYLKPWKEKDDSVYLSIAGYNFKINLATKNTFISSPDMFGKNILGENSTAEHIYANILLEEIPLFNDNNLNYTTWILRDKSDTDKCGNANAELDLLVKNKDPEDTNSYYFSGLAFSTTPYTNTEGTRSEYYPEIKNTNKKRIVSLCILDHIDNAWTVHQPALLPNIEHGDTENSVKIPGDFEADIVNTTILNVTDAINKSGVPVPTIYLSKVSNTAGETCWQLRFSDLKIDE